MDVARLIKSDVGLQVAAVDYGDWDMHVDLGKPVAGAWMYDHLVDFSQSYMSSVANGWSHPETPEVWPMTWRTSMPCDCRSSGEPTPDNCSTCGEL